MTSYHPAVHLLYLCFAAYWLSQRSTVGSCSSGLDYILAALDYTPLHRSFQTIFDFVSLHMWIILSLYATPSWMQNGTWATSVIFIMRSIPGDHNFFFLLSFLTHQEQDCGERERMKAITWTLQISAERMVSWLLCFFFPLLFFFLWWNAFECCRHWRHYHHLMNISPVGYW